MGEAAAKAKLPDPDHWAIEWPNGYVQASWHSKQPGYFTCGVLRAIGGSEDNYRVINFVAVIDGDEVKTLEISGKDRNSRVNVMCGVLVARGKLPPAQLMVKSPQDFALARIGLTVRLTPEGAYVVSVMEGSPVRGARLLPGMVLIRANGIALAGLGHAATEVLDADVPVMALETATGMRLTVRRMP